MRSDTLKCLSEINKREYWQGQRARVPVILDEAFRLSDNERFQALVESIERYAGEDRQVIYLTADRREVSAWRKRTKELELPAPTVIDLGRARRLSIEDAAEEDGESSYHTLGARASLALSLMSME